AAVREEMMDRYEKEAFDEAVRNRVHMETVRLRGEVARHKVWRWACLGAFAAAVAHGCIAHAAPFTLFVDGYRSVEGELVPLGGPTRTPTPVPTLSPAPQTPATPGKCSGLSLDGRLGLR